LSILVVDAGRGREEETPRTGFARREEEVRVDQHAQHAQGLVLLDEAHATHVGGQVEDLVDLATGLAAVIRTAQVELQILGAAVHLVPFADGLDVDAAQAPDASPREFRRQVSADETAGSGDQNRSSWVGFHLTPGGGGD
jgi:hypothetical protein